MQNKIKQILKFLALSVLVVGCKSVNNDKLPNTVTNVEKHHINQKHEEEKTYGHKQKYVKNHKHKKHTKSVKGEAKHVETEAAQPVNRHVQSEAAVVNNVTGQSQTVLHSLPYTHDHGK